MIAKQQLFLVGRTLATPGAIEALSESGESTITYFTKHATGNWGDLSDEDRQMNDEAVRDGSRILSAYTLKSGQKIWVITEARDDHGKRATSTILLPEEY